MYITYILVLSIISIFFALQLLQLPYQPSQLAVSIISIVLCISFIEQLALATAFFKTTTIAFKIAMQAFALNEEIYGFLVFHALIQVFE